MQIFTKAIFLYRNLKLVKNKINDSDEIVTDLCEN